MPYQYRGLSVTVIGQLGFIIQISVFDICFHEGLGDSCVSGTEQLHILPDPPVGCTFCPFCISAPCFCLHLYGVFSFMQYGTDRKGERIISVV